MMVLMYLCVVLCVGSDLAHTHHSGEGSCTRPDTPEETGYCHIDTSGLQEDEEISETLQTGSHWHHASGGPETSHSPDWQYRSSEAGISLHQEASVTQKDPTQQQSEEKRLKVFQTIQERPLEFPEEGTREDSQAGPVFGEGDFVDTVWVLRCNAHLESFIRRGSVSIIYFYRKSGSDSLARFLQEYTQAAADLYHYHILLATVDCSQYPAVPYCGPDKVDNFAYGFREAQEKIAFPLDTLFNANAIVASALHLALINTVPILQTATERRDLEARCKGRCNIVFAFLRTLGTLEHRMFLELAFGHQNDFVFAITTYTAGTLGLTAPPPADGEHESSVWALHCQDKRLDEDCIVSHYRDRVVTSHLLRFLSALCLPLWHELSESGSVGDVVTPYDGSGLAWVVLVYDGSSRGRVTSLAPHLAQLLHGSVAVLTLDLDGMSDRALRKLGLTRHSLIPPAIAFIHPDQEETSVLNDYDDPLTWVKEQLEARDQEDTTDHHQPPVPVQPVEELQHDDETVLGMMSEESFNVPALAGPDPYLAAITSDTLTVIAYYLAWDPVSNALLQHLDLVQSALSSQKSHATVYRLNCFDWPHECDAAGVKTFPALRLHTTPSHNFTYDGPIHRDYILKTILLLESGGVVEVGSMAEVMALLSLEKELHPACPFLKAATIAFFSAREDAAAFKKAAPGLESTHLLSLHISTLATHNMCGDSSGCVVVSKPSDRFQPRRVLSQHLNNPQSITDFIKHASLPVMAQLDPERYYTLVMGGNKEDTEASLKHLVILFLPAITTLSSSTIREGSQDGNTETDIEGQVAEDEWGGKIGHLATEMSEPGFLFSWLLCEDPLAVELLSAYGLPEGERSLAALTLGPTATTLHLFPPTNTSQPAFKDWLSTLRTGTLMPTVELPEGEWRPRMEGFDFLKFIREDQDREAEDQLILEMEADLSSGTTHGKNDEVKKYSQDEL